MKPFMFIQYSQTCYYGPCLKLKPALLWRGSLIRPWAFLYLHCLKWKPVTMENFALVRCFFTLRRFDCSNWKPVWHGMFTVSLYNCHYFWLLTQHLCMNKYLTYTTGILRVEDGDSYREVPYFKANLPEAILYKYVYYYKGKWLMYPEVFVVFARVCTCWTHYIHL